MEAKVYRERIIHNKNYGGTRSMNRIETRNLETDYISSMTNDEVLVSDIGYYSFLRLSDNRCCYDSAAHIRKMKEHGIKILILPMKQELYSFGKTLFDFAREKELELDIDLHIERSMHDIIKALHDFNLWYAFCDYKSEVMLKSLKDWLLKNGIESILI